MSVGGTHVHHLVPGILRLLASGMLGIAGPLPHGFHWVVPLMYGTGAALTPDEFALWLTLKDVQWEKEGRCSVGPVTGDVCNADAAGVLLAIILFPIGAIGAIRPARLHSNRVRAVRRADDDRCRGTVPARPSHADVAVARAVPFPKRRTFTGTAAT